MGSLRMIEVLDVIYRMSEGGLLRSNMLRSPRQIDIVDRLRVEKPGEWQSKNSLKVIVHRRIKELIGEHLIEEKKKRYHLTYKGKHYLTSNVSLIRSNFKRNWGEVNLPSGMHASFGVNTGFLINDRRREQLVKEKISGFLSQLEEMTPDDTLDLKLNININKDASTNHNTRSKNTRVDEPGNS
jgi:hypothetical protein